jgi:superfamily II DNA or RNA helicase
MQYKPVDIALRPYQQAAIDAIKAHWGRGKYEGLIHLWTGAGKTVVSGAVINDLCNLHKERVLFVGGVNRDLVTQAALSFKKLLPYLNLHITAYKQDRPGIGIVMGSRNDVTARVISASVQTLVDKTDSIKENAPEAEPITEYDVVKNKFNGVELSPKSRRQFLISPRMDEILKYGLIDVWIHDEAHHAVADGSFIMIQRMHQLYEAIEAPPLRIVGNTATPVRTDGIGLHNVFKRAYFSRDIAYGQRHGWVADFATPISVNIFHEELPDNEVELSESELQAKTSRISVVEDWMGVMYQSWLDHAQNRPTIAYTGPMGEMGPIDAGKAFREYLQNKGVNAAHVSANGCIDENGDVHGNEYRRQMFHDFMVGKLQIIVNYNVIVEGVDVPPASAILLARSVNELTFTQIIGRILRKFEGDPTNGVPAKEDALVIDFTGKPLVLATLGLVTGFEYDPMQAAFEKQIDTEAVIDYFKQADDESLQVNIEAQMFADEAYLWELIGLVRNDDTDGLKFKHWNHLLKLMRFVRDEDTILGGTLHPTTGDTVVHKGVSYSVAKIVSQSRGDWFIDEDGHMSVSVNADTAMFIANPDYKKAYEFDTYVDALTESDAPLEVIEAVSYLRDLFGASSLWEVNTKKGTTSPQPIGIDTDLTQLEVRALETAMTKGYEASFLEKRKSWKARTRNGVINKATDKQLQFLERVKHDYVKVAQEDELTKGDASKLITHYLASKPVLRDVIGKWETSIQPIIQQHTNLAK